MLGPHVGSHPHTPWSKLQLQDPVSIKAVRILSLLSFLARPNLKPAHSTTLYYLQTIPYEQGSTVHSLANQLAHAQRANLKVNVGLCS
jgi:hypothetical protein